LLSLEKYQPSRHLNTEIHVVNPVYAHWAFKKYPRKSGGFINSTIN